MTSQSGSADCIEVTVASAGAAGAGEPVTASQQCGQDRFFGLGTFLDWVHLVGISVWLGGIVVWGAIGAPAVFRAARSAGHTEPGMALFDFAGTAVSLGFERFGRLALVLGLIALVSGVGAALLQRACPVRLTVRALLTLAAAGLAAWLDGAVVPSMAALRGSGSAEFARLHDLSANLYRAEAVLLLGILALTVLLHAPHPHGGKRATPGLRSRPGSAGSRR